MSTHPFAIRLDAIIAKLRDILENLKRAKKSADDAGDRPVPGLPHKPRRPRHVQLGGIAASGMERQAVAESGFQYDRQTLEKNADPEMRRLQNALTKEESKCAQMRARANISAGREVQTPCPGVTAARDALQRYMTRRFGNVGPSPRGGGGGGGW